MTYYDLDGNPVTKEQLQAQIDQQFSSNPNYIRTTILDDDSQGAAAAPDYSGSQLGNGGGESYYSRTARSSQSAGGSWDDSGKYDGVYSPGNYMPDYTLYYERTPVGQAYAKAMQKIGNDLGEKPTYNNKYDLQLEEAYNGIVNRKPFSWSEDTDPFWKKYRDRYTELGQQAMKDTMGQAAALTGGYGNTYAQFAGQGAYNRYMEALADKGIELEERAYQRYQDAGDELYRQYTLLGNLRDTEYGRYRDAVSDYNYQLALLQAQEAEDYARAQYANNLRIQAEQTGYSRYRDALNDARYEDELGYSRWRDTISDERYEDETAYSRSRDAVADDQWAQEFALKQAAQAASAGGSSGSSGRSSGGSSGSGSSGSSTISTSSAPAWWNSMSDAERKELQRNIGTPADGVWGPNTARAYMAAFGSDATDAPTKIGINGVTAEPIYGNMYTEASQSYVESTLGYYDDNGVWHSPYVKIRT